MSNCYDHSIKKNMLSTVYGSKEDLKKDILKNYQELQKWYEEYAGDTWEENNKDD